MVEHDLEFRGFASYVDAIRRGSTDPYVAYRICEQSWKVAPDDAELLRQAVIRLIEADPWFLATANPHVLHVLGTKDLERLTPFVGAGPARSAAALLRAMLWYHGGRGPHPPDRSGRSQLRRALGFLQQVKRSQRDGAWHEMVVGCYRVLDYAQYKRAFSEQLRFVAPIWHAAALHGFLDFVASKKDWKTYEHYRREWDRLPPGHHACECYVNDVCTDDGLRAAAARKWNAIPDALVKAGAVHGCPHLNTRGLRLDLVRLLISRNKQLNAAAVYLDRAAQFHVGGQEVAKLRQRLHAAADG